MQTAMEHRHVWMRLAASRARIQSQNDWRHWRLYIDPSLKEVPLKSCQFFLNDSADPIITTGTDKIPEQNGFFVWFNCKDGVMCGHAPIKRFSVLTANLYDPSTDKHWMTVSRAGSQTPLPHFRITSNGTHVPVQTRSHKHADERGVLAWLHFFGHLHVDENGHARVELLHA